MTGRPQRNARRLLSARKWLALATLTCGTTLQLSACRDELGLFGVRTAFSTIFLPINNLIIFISNVVATTISSFIGI